MNDTLTIDQLIARLTEAREKIGGDKGVYFGDYDAKFGVVFNYGRIEDYLYTDKSGVGFEINRIEK